MPRILSSPSTNTTRIGQTDHAQPSGGTGAGALKRRPAIHVKLPGLKSSGKPMQAARMARKNGIAQSGATTSRPEAPKTDASQPHAQVQANAHEADLIDLSDPPPTTKPAAAQPSLLEATPAELHAVHTPVLQPTVLHSAAPPAPQGAQPPAHTLAAAGMPSLQDIHHTTDQTIAMQHALGQANQRLAIAEMLNSFMQKVIEMIKKAASPP